MRGVSPRPHRRGSSGDLTLTPTTSRSIPLIDISRSPSPYPRSRSAAQSEDEDEDVDVPISLRPLIRDADDVSERRGVAARRGWKSIWREGGLGRFLFGTWMGYQVYVSLLVIWIGGCGFGLLLTNRFIWWTGVYKFPYPLTTTWIQLGIAHVLLMAWSSLTRAIARPLQILGMKGLVAPSTPGPMSSSGYRTGKPSLATAFKALFKPGIGGIAGGGVLEFDRKTALLALPPAIVFMGMTVLSNLSFAYYNSYAVLPLYTLSRIGTIPLSLTLTAFLTRTSHSVSTLSSALTATLNLLLASIRPGVRVTWEGVVTGVFSTIFVSLFPIMLLRTYRSLATSLIPQGDLLTSFQPDLYASDALPYSDPSGTREETRAYYLTLHYTSMLSLCFLTPLVLLSGELSKIYHNCYFLDVPFFWFEMLCASVASFTIFAPFLLLVKATSPLAATFVSVPRDAFQLVILGGKMPVHAWVGVALCWMGTLWFAGVRRAEGRRWAVGTGAGLGR
ncbi:hypothetical protein NA57DRAFT_40103 [Rhizodiscina lignyota]|uniref:GDP-mannose transporter n=1 Tax=Rhizodiscina lignyota TaxID=1504668 RepID=A0A9P4IDM6_9PEZI|nr:hypothetical protein NA57DRAFT_40103 [Rhizodiscina lignyota]